MTRDMDLIRDILLAFEANKILDGRLLHRGRASDFFGKDGISEGEIAYGLRLLIDRNSVIGSYDRTSGTFDIERLSMDGHDFLDLIRDPDVWNKTKEGALAAGGFSIELLVDLAKGFIKKKIEDHTGIKL